MQAVESKTYIALKEVLLATDFSPCSEAALPYATALARRFGARLHLAHIAPATTVMMVPPADYIPAFPREPMLQVDLLRQTEDKLLALTLSPLCVGLRFDTIIGKGDPARMLARMVADRDIDLVVLGTHGNRGLDRVLLGSVAEELLRTLPCPVLTVGPKTCVHHHDVVEIRRMVFATALPADRERVAPFAISMARECSAQLVLLHVVKLDQKAFSFSRVMAEEDARQRLLETFPECGTELWCKPLVAFGDPAEQIVEAARGQHADLIAMGAHHTAFPAVATHLGGGAAHRVLLEAPCPVLTVLH